MAARALSGCLETEGPMTAVARLTKEPCFPAHQQVLIRASMGRMTARAPFHFDRGMLVDKRAALFRMAGNAGVIVIGFFQQRLGQRAMGIVAVRAFHETIQNPVTGGQGELSLDRPVAADTEFLLVGSQQALVQPSRLFPKCRSAGELRNRERGLDCIGLP